ncbi:MAG TPA: class I SAM-dependent methyltransferase [Gammaproteobacteria bacterium]|nr:class I SAM-dependent methyltransferase [Gammaproteobacteria bacterium]|tara:strand:+ start:6078 stop:7301 length:1224 start_codon:yes stop_codon:yes gene_type:complete
MTSKVAHESVDQDIPFYLQPLKQLRHGCIKFDGFFKWQIGSDEHLKTTIHVHDKRMFNLILKNGELGAAEAYIKGYWTCDDLVTLIQILARNRELLDKLNNIFFARAKQALLYIKYKFQRNSVSGSKKNIAQHYDLSNDFFELFLDKHMMYSSAVYDSQHQTLEAASEYKMQLICEKLQLKPTDHLVEIGSGWGGFACYAAKHYGCKVTTITISKEQFAKAEQRIQDMNLQALVDIKLEDYRSLQGKYDKLVSIEMIEAVGANYLNTYFNQIRKLLKPDGLALIQAITIEDSRYTKALNTVDFIKHYIFPGSFIPCISVMTKTAADNKLQLTRLDDIGLSYAQTLHDWRKQFFDVLPQVKALGFNDEFIRMWDFYLCYCEGGFKEKVISNVHLLFQNNDLEGRTSCG